MNCLIGSIRSPDRSPWCVVGASNDSQWLISITRCWDSSVMILPNIHLLMSQSHFNHTSTFLKFASHDIMRCLFSRQKNYFNDLWHSWDLKDHTAVFLPSSQFFFFKWSQTARLLKEHSSKKKKKKGEHECTADAATFSLKKKEKEKKKIASRIMAFHQPINFTCD